MIWQIVISLAISLIVSAATKPKAPQTDNSVDNIKAPTAEPGQNIRVIFGTVYVESVFITWGQLTRVIPVKKKGGKK